MTGPGNPGRSDRPRWRLVRAGTDAVPAWVRRFFASRRPAEQPRQRRPFRPHRRSLVIAGGVLAVLMLGGWLLWATPVLGVREIQVTGAGILSVEQVRQAAAVPDRTPLPRVRTNDVAARVEALPAVADAQVRRAWPRTLVIEVVERTGVAAVPTGDQYALIDVDGVVFHQQPESPVDLPLLLVDSPGPEDPATRAALTVLAALTPELRADLETLTVAGPVSIELSLFSGWTVLWGDETASEDKARVATALLDHEGLPNPAATVIDVSAPEVVSVR